VDRISLKYKWRIAWPDAADADSWKTDFMGWDGDVPVGRIRFEPMGLKKNLWQWSGQGPQRLPKGRLMPQQGYLPAPREAAAAVEDYYDRLLQHNGIKRP
jgi:hypothetical protein